MITVWIDEFTPCLKDALTGDIIETEVVQITRKSYLSKYNRRTQWYVNWAELLAEHEVYALVIKGTTDVQGLVALQKNDDYQAVYVAWMCVAPQNNKEIVDQPKYIGEKTIFQMNSKLMKINEEVIMNANKMECDKNMERISLPSCSRNFWYYTNHNCFFAVR